MSTEEFDEFIKNLSEDQKKELSIALKTGTVKDEKIAPKLVPKTQDGSFTTSIQKEQTEGETFGVPVTEMPRFNTFEDNGSEHQDKHNSTPAVELTERRRPPFKKVKQVCTRCSRTVETHPQHSREFYICDRCLKR
jgi:hypothetical protein